FCVEEIDSLKYHLDQLQSSLLPLLRPQTTLLLSPLDLPAIHKESNTHFKHFLQIRSELEHTLNPINSTSESPLTNDQCFEVLIDTIMQTESTIELRHRSDLDLQHHSDIDTHQLPRKDVRPINLTSIMANVNHHFSVGAQRESTIHLAQSVTSIIKLSRLVFNTLPEDRGLFSTRYLKAVDSKKNHSLHLQICVLINSKCYDDKDAVIGPNVVKSVETLLVILNMFCDL
ncbi:hypothetical protein MJO28_007089, partial [Puccinia striiformis f. sp. tritici]